jgi:hypothetical protein
MQIHSCSLEDIQFGVIIFSEDYGDDAAAAFVVALVWERWFTRTELDSDLETSWMPEGTWAIAQRLRHAFLHEAECLFHH